MFIVMTLLCCWLGWEASVVRERQSVRRELGANPAFIFVTVKAWAEAAIGVPTPKARIPIVRVWLGDEAIQQIGYMPYMPGFSEDAVKRLSRVFPEAQLQESNPIEPCHPGCFPAGTLVETPGGLCPIERVRPGDLVISISPTGGSAGAEVQAVFTTENRLWKVETEAGALFTTETQPLCLADSRTLAAGKLQPGDEILWCQNGSILPVRVLDVRRTARTEPVFNLVLGDEELFVAGGFVARSKPPADSAVASVRSTTGDVTDDQ
jgi:hypothetical protein